MKINFFIVKFALQNTKLYIVVLLTKLNFFWKTSKKFVRIDFFASAALVQDRIITGTVTSSADKRSVPELSVTGTQIGTVANANDKYSVKVSLVSRILDFVLSVI